MIKKERGKLSMEKNRIRVKALGDGEFRLTATCNNGGALSEIISELEFSITGLGLATQDPYGFVPGCQFNKASTDETKLSFEGGVFIPSNETSFVTFVPS